jgi:hypothetical protein
MLTGALQSWDISVGRQSNCPSIPSKDKNCFSSPKRLDWLEGGGDPTYWVPVTLFRILSDGGRDEGRHESEHLPQSSTEVENSWNRTSVRPYRPTLNCGH